LKCDRSRRACAISRPDPTTAAAVALSVLVAAALFLPGLGAAPFDDPGEGQHAEIARELWVSGDWLTLRLNGVRYFDKPPLLYWLGAGAFALLGPVEWAARLVPVLGALLAAAATALLGSRLLGPRGGLLAAAALCASPLFAAFARYVRPETLFTATIQWGLTGLLIAAAARDGSGRPWALVGCAALGAASLAKDPLGLLGPLAAVALALALAGRLRPIERWLPALGLAALAVLGLGWYAVAAALHRGFLWYTVVDNHILNVARARRFPDEDVPLSALEFLAASGLGAFPWIIGAAAAMWGLLRRRAWRDPEELPWIALSIWAAGVFLAVALSPFRLPHYGLPAYPAVALLAMRAWYQHSAGPRALAVLHALLFLGLAAACLLAAASDGRSFTEAVFGLSDVAARKHSALGEPGGEPPWEAMQALLRRTGLWAGLGGVALGAVALAPRARLALPVAAATMLALVPSVTAGVALVASGRAVAAMAAEVRAWMGPQDLLVHEGPIENSGAIEFYSGRRPVLLDGTRSVLGMGATFPEAREIFWDAERLKREWSGPRRLFLLTPRPPERSVAAFLPRDRLRLIAARAGRWLYDNCPPGLAACPEARQPQQPVAPAAPAAVR
jgi:4-amino-4-deoxy-L-arabinose transferase-like glycosyltransferase